MEHLVKLSGRQFINGRQVLLLVNLNCLMVQNISNGHSRSSGNRGVSSVPPLAFRGPFKLDFLYNLIMYYPEEFLHGRRKTGAPKSLISYGLQGFFLGGRSWSISKSCTKIVSFLKLKMNTAVDPLLSSSHLCKRTLVLRSFMRITFSHMFRFHKVQNYIWHILYSFRAWQILPQAHK